MLPYSIRDASGSMGSRSRGRNAGAGEWEKAWRGGTMVYAMACADDNYMPSARFQLETALKKGKVDKTLCFHIADMDEEFQNKNRRILESGGERRKGCYLWKPYFVNKALNDIAEGDFLIYMDGAGGYYRSNVAPIIACMTRNNIDMVGSRRYKYLEKHWTKRDAFVYMDCDKGEYTDQHQCWAGMFVLRKTANTCRIMEEWLEYAQDYRIITDAPNTCGLDNYEGFEENRHDQSILSLLMRKHHVRIIEELPVADFYVYHHTRETSVRAVKAELARRRREQIKKCFEKKDIKGIYYIERERAKNLLWVQKSMRSKDVIYKKRKGCEKND